MALQERFEMRLSEEERRRLRSRASARGVTDSEYLRDFIRRAPVAAVTGATLTVSVPIPDYARAGDNPPDAAA